MPVATRKRKAALAAETGKEEQLVELPSSSPRTKRQKNLPLRSKENEAEAASDTKAPAAPKGNIITFDDEGNADRELIVPTASKPAKPEEPQEEESDDDEAPEAVSTTKVAKDVKKSSHAAQKAAQEYVKIPFPVLFLICRILTTVLVRSLTYLQTSCC